MPDLNRRVKLNVGGQLFETTVGTLSRVHGTTLEKLVENIDACGNEPIFIDHDPKYFSSVLNFLRDGRIPLPDNIKDIDELRREAQVYQDSCCVDVTFAMFNYLYHIPAKMLQLVGNGYTSTEE
ncbi:unnamed protein product [Strongylus vulgaris]|uniref:BTB domain-containing protein n=1 Tax=Strongylus vulgaris TaxID=40348 RepID=A0A3P7J5R1_STRVU|nr:unnamed protein product [Strongylus vulgaris]